ADEPADAVITDLVMPELNGVEVTRRLRRTDPHLPIFVLTGHGEVATAIEALKAGATEYLTKPVNIDELMTLLTRALAARPLVEEGAPLKQARAQEFSTGAILGAHPNVEAVRAFVRKMAAIPRPTVLLLGQRGQFRSDLYYRVSAAATTWPPLRTIKSDIPILADHFRQVFAAEFKKKVDRIESVALDILSAWRWPGNVRELRNVIERAMI